MGFGLGNVGIGQGILGIDKLTTTFTFEFGGRDAFIDEFFIAEPYRNAGFGR